MEPFTIALALIPIGSLLTSLSKEVLNTAIAAQDVAVEKENFKTLARFLKDVQCVLIDFQRQNLSDSSAMRAALENMKVNVLEAQKVLKDTDGKSRFLLLINSRKLVKSAQKATRNIGEALQLLLAAGSEVQMDICDHAYRLKEMMVTAEFQASADQTRVMNSLEKGLQEHKTDQTFANNILRQIAQAVGLSQDHNTMKLELETFKREAEEVALKKQDQERAFMEQVIAILDRAEAVSPPEDPILKYRKLVQKASRAGGQLPPYPSFLCPLTKEVMKDPVILGCTEKTYEKSAILEHFDGQSEGSCTDPESGQILVKKELRPNNSLRAGIEEWDALNKIIRIREAKESLLCAVTSKQKSALEDLDRLCEMKAEYKYWIAAEGILEAILHLWTASRLVPKEFRELSLSTMTMIVTNIDLNRERMVDAGGLTPIIKSLIHTYHQSSAVALLFELSKNKQACDMIPEVKGAILSLATVFLQRDIESDVREKVRVILERLSEVDENVQAMAMANLVDPLISRLATGPDTTKVCLSNFLAERVRESDVNPDNKTLLAEGAVIQLATMLKSSKFALKSSALAALRNLSSWRNMKSHISESGAVADVLLLLKNTNNQLQIRESAAMVVLNLCSEDGAKYIAEVGEKHIPVSQVVPLLLNPGGVSSSVLRIRTLRALLGLSKDKEARKFIQDETSVQFLFAEVWGSDRDARRCSLKILMGLAQNEGAEQVFDQLQRTKGEADLVKLMTDVDEDAQASVAGILANLPLGREQLTASILAAGVVPATVSLINSEVEEVQAKALATLRRFTDSDVETQKAAASLDVHTRLIELLRTGAPRSQAGAAYVLRNFSRSTPKLVSEVQAAGWTCALKRRPRLCRVHGGKCSVKSTFCLVAAGAVGPLVSLLGSDDTDWGAGEAGDAALDTLETLVGGDDIVHSGAIALHEVHGIQPLFGLLRHEEHAERAVLMLEHIFKVPTMKEEYRRSASLPLRELAAPPNSTVLRTRAARLLASIDTANMHPHSATHR
ncbi:hypothetical protein MPTK1_1g23740 [Marchantia polymorpha subsp. ruderalis]|uniref:RING-type E3 ubiquitin transferase n=2 Tax=Marchantia polymorpha TaxID=3197 RepID=A0A176WPC7_MARPO|nr:hypothetical protein AXG93_1864s1040 [Marchantia polymorpha subsp. ruderalis]PTQ36179.1 hypothetical protein MARPO_0065s0003 [Marchantia polymorpha]BBM99776.1 hypothetical protein Mp_1g23740 [Marchantia polymorpha subsp. ruderalis]|eukprot:PTQ36179.1 hypothetical protein MARPO_0065s0003 [Marchantia polymorpha]